MMDTPNYKRHTKEELINLVLGYRQDNTELRKELTTLNVVHENCKKSRSELIDTLEVVKTDREKFMRQSNDTHTDLLTEKRERKEEVDQLKQKVDDLRMWKQQAQDRCQRYEQRIMVLTDSLRDVAVEKDILY